MCSDCAEGLWYAEFLPFMGVGSGKCSACNSQDYQCQTTGSGCHTQVFCRSQTTRIPPAEMSAGVVTDRYPALKHTSCSDVLATNPHAQSGTYTIRNPDGSGPLTVYCDMEAVDDGGWTLVYKIADDSDMMSTGAVNPDGLAQADGVLESSGSGKLSDVAIRSLCTEQYKVVQMGSSLGPLYCSFDDITQYAPPYDFRSTTVILGTVACRW